MEQDKEVNENTKTNIFTNLLIPNLTTNVPFVKVAKPTENAKAPNI